jgi:hypothetical protein
MLILRALWHLDEVIIAIGSWRVVIAIHGWPIHLVIVHIAVHSGTIYLRAIESSGQGVHWAVHLASHCAIAHRSVQVLVHWGGKSAVIHAANTSFGSQLCSFVLFAHAVNVWPKALFEPAYLPEDFFTANHFFFAVAGGCDVGQLVHECARCVDEFGEGGRGPVWN